MTLWIHWIQCLCVDSECLCGVSFVVQGPTAEFAVLRVDVSL